MPRKKIYPNKKILPFVYIRNSEHLDNNSQIRIIFMTFILGTILVAIGVVLVIKSEWFYQNFGSIQWAEIHLGSSGGSRLMYKLIGIAFILLGLMGITGLLKGFLLWILSPLTKHVK